MSSHGLVYKIKFSHSTYLLLSIAFSLWCLYMRHHEHILEKKEESTEGDNNDNFASCYLLLLAVWGDGVHPFFIILIIFLFFLQV